MPKRSARRPMQDAADGEADHGRGVGQRGAAAVDAELGLDGRQHHHRDHMPTPPIVLSASDASEPPPGIAPVRLVPARHSAHSLALIRRGRAL